VRSLSILACLCAMWVAAAPAQAANTFLITPFAQASSPAGVAVDAAGDVYIADAAGNEVLRVTPAGATSVAASGLNAASGVALDPATGDVYIADTGNHEVKRLAVDGSVTVVAGTGAAGGPTPGPATASALGGPSGLAFDSAGDLYIADGGGAGGGNPYVEKMALDGTLSIVAGSGTRAQPVAGTATSSPLRAPTGVATDANGNVFIADGAANVVAKVTPAGTLSIFAGRANGAAGQPTAGTATYSRLNDPTGLATDTAGNLYIADTANNRIEEVTPADRLSVFAGTGVSGAPSYGSSALLSKLSSPEAVALSGAGIAYVANTTHATVDRIALAPPAIAVVPAPTGTATQDHTLTAVTGTWNNAPQSFAYQWQRCTATGSGCADISGATGSTYTLTGTDAGGTVRTLVTATNVSGSTTVASASTAVVIPLPPASLTLPAIAGTAIDVQTLAASPGTWSNSPTKFTYQWQDCDASGASCTAISGATQSMYQLALTDVGGTVRVAVTATNAGGHATATSAPTTLIQPALMPWADTPPPAPLSAPAVSGTPAVGATLSCATGSWSNSPTGYDYQWNRGNAPIADATAATYTVTTADLGQALSCTVTASNSGGAIQADSARLNIPRPVVCPAASGALSGAALGPLQLGDTRSQARVLLPHYQGSTRADSFCLAGGQSLRAVYASATLVRSAIARADRAKVSGRVILILSSDRRYAIRGIHPGARASAVRRAGRPLRIGRTTWYVIPGSRSNGVIELRGRSVVAVGIADKRLSTGGAAATRLLRGV
jgi:sugar lactone lactonase YvrE